MDSASPQLPPPCADDFERLESLGSGSVGSVHKVRHKVTRDIYALKVISKALVFENELGPQLLAEVSTQSQLSHRNLLSCLGFFEDAEHVYLVLEYAAEGDLLRLLRRRGPLSEATAAHVFAQIAEGVRYLHNQGIIHRDLKAENVLLGPGFHAKIADFGWCAQAGGRTTFCGTPCMLAPEMFTGKSYDGGVDIWALGVVLYEMLAGSSPFSAKGGSLEDACNKIVSEGFDEKLLVNIPMAAHSLLRGLLRREVAKRMTLQDALRHPWVVLQRSRRVVAQGPGANSLLSVASPLSAASSPSSNLEAKVSPVAYTASDTPGPGRLLDPSPVSGDGNKATLGEEPPPGVDIGMAPPSNHKDLRALLEAGEQKPVIPCTSILVKPVQPPEGAEADNAGGLPAAPAPLPPSFRAPPSAGDMAASAELMPSSLGDLIVGTRAPGSLPGKADFQVLPSSGDLGGRPVNGEFGFHMPTSGDFAGLRPQKSSPDSGPCHANPAHGDIGGLAPPASACDFHGLNSAFDTPCFSESSIADGERWQPADAKIDEEPTSWSPERTGWSIEPSRASRTGAQKPHSLGSFDSPCFSESSMLDGDGWKPVGAKTPEEQMSWSVDPSPSKVEKFAPNVNEFGMPPLSDDDLDIRGGYLMSVRNLGLSNKELPKPWSEECKLPQSFLLLTPRWDKEQAAPSANVDGASQAPSSLCRPQVPPLNLGCAEAAAQAPRSSLLQPPATSLQIVGRGREPHAQKEERWPNKCGPPRTYETLLLSLFQKVVDDVAAEEEGREVHADVPETGRIVPPSDRVPIVMRDDSASGPLPKAKVRARPAVGQGSSPTWASPQSPMGQSSPSYQQPPRGSAASGPHPPSPAVGAYSQSPVARASTAKPVANGGYPARADRAYSDGARMSSPQARQPMGGLLRNSLVPASGLRGGVTSVNNIPPLIAHIMQLGFTEQQAQAAARRTSSVEGAVEWLLQQGVGA